MKVLSYSLFEAPPSAHRRGPVEGYSNHLRGVVRAHLALFPPKDGFELRLHHDASLYRLKEAPELFRLQAVQKIQLVFRAERALSLCGPMLWRLDPIWDSNVSHVFCRDVDALPTPRDRYAIEEFLASGKTFHDLHDSPSHGVGLCGGMCGFDARAIRAKFPERIVLDRIVNKLNRLGERRGSDRVLVIGGIPVGAVDFDEPGADQTVLALFARTVALGQDQGAFAPSDDDPWAKDALTVGPVAGQERAKIRPVPLKNVRQDWLAEGDKLCNHLGQAGFDVERAVAFYDDDTENAIDFIKPPLQTLAKTPLGGLRRVVISSDLNDNYFFFLPLTCLLWRRRFGFQPTVILVGSPQAWQRNAPARLALEETIRTSEASVHFVEPRWGKTSTVAQVSRLFGWALPGVTNLDEVWTTDVDLWLLRSMSLLLSYPGDRDFYVTYGNAYNSDPENAPKYPICHLGARRETWREVVLGELPSGMSLSLDTFESIFWSALYQIVEAAQLDAAAQWNADEEFFGRCLKFWQRDPKHFVHYGMRFGQPPNDRLDRARWEPIASIKDAEALLVRRRVFAPDGSLTSASQPIVDAHLPRPGYGTRWEEIWRLFSARLPEFSDWAHAYHKSFLSAMELA